MFIGQRYYIILLSSSMLVGPIPNIMIGILRSSSELAHGFKGATFPNKYM